MNEVVEDEAAILLAEARERVDVLLGAWAERLQSLIPGREGDALAYALLSPGKRVRAALVIASYRAVGGLSPAIAAVAAAVETVHAYSLVHDDLPCMDDDDLRRGRLTVHRQYDVATATRVGYQLVPVAAQVLAQAAADLAVGPAVLGRMAVTLFQAGGIEGMVGGQWLDLEAEQRALNLSELVAVHRGKTGALISASCALGALAAECGPAKVAALADFGADIGLAFQVADDILDVTSTSAELGKTAGRDIALQKSTYVKLLGVHGAIREAERLATRAVHHLDANGVPSASLATLARYIVTRSS